MMVGSPLLLAQEEVTHRLDCASQYGCLNILLPFIIGLGREYALMLASRGAKVVGMLFVKIIHIQL